MFNLDFLIAALIFLVLIWLHFSRVNTIKDTNGKIFILYFVTGVLDIVLDIISSYIIGLHNPKLNGLGMLFTTLLYVFQVIISFCMVIYGISLRDISYDEMISEIKSWALCPIVMLIAVFANIFYGQFFSLMH